MTEAKKNARQRRKEQQKQRQGRWLLITGILALLTMIIYFTWQEAGGGTANSAVTVADPTLGPATAPVEITEYADFGCPACRGWHNAGIREQILAAFGDQVRFVWKDFPVITPQSPQAAEAGQCAAAQGKFWEFHDLVYEQFAGLEVDALQGYAARIGLDLVAFTQCLEQRVMRAKVQANDQEARRLGLRGTPSFAINGRPLPAPPSFDQLAALIQQELAQSD
jgi:formate-nitrite transporter family protein